MTHREFYSAVAKANVSEELTEQATKFIEALNKKNAKRAKKPSKTQLANEPIKESILAYLENGKVQTASDIAEAIGITVQKASALAQQLAENGKLAQAEIEVPKRGKRKAYSINTNSSLFLHLIASHEE